MDTKEKILMTALHLFARDGYENVRDFTSAQLTFWTEDDFASHFRKMLILEQYKDEELGKMYSDCILEGPVAYMKDIFGQMIANKVLKEADSRLLAVQFYAPVYLCIQLYDRTYDAEGIQKLLKAHMNKFFVKNAL